MNKFSSFLNRKCKSNKNSIRKIASLSKITHPYLLDLMSGKKNPPDINTQINIANALELNQTEKTRFFDLAAKERRRTTSRHI